jgi:hypothetical protein
VLATSPVAKKTRRSSNADSKRVTPDPPATKKPTETQKPKTKATSKTTRPKKIAAPATSTAVKKPRTSKKKKLNQLVQKKAEDPDLDRGLDSLQYEMEVAEEKKVLTTHGYLLVEGIWERWIYSRWMLDLVSKKPLPLFEEKRGGFFQADVRIPWSKDPAHEKKRGH